MKKLVWTIGIVIMSLGLPAFSATPPPTATAVFAGGCFWCMQADMDKVKGVIHTAAGYAGGTAKNPTYEQVSAGGTGYYESVKVEYNPTVITYAELLNDFWHNIDPTDMQGQFCDKGAQYQAAIFYEDPTQKNVANQSKQQLIASNRFGQVVTQILPSTTFYPAEEYHQEYYKKNPLRYKFYRYNCGRDKRLEQLWGKSTTSN